MWTTYTLVHRSESTVNDIDILTTFTYSPKITSVFFHKNTFDHILIHSKGTDKSCCNLSNSIHFDNLNEKK